MSRIVASLRGVLQIRGGNVVGQNQRVPCGQASGPRARRKPTWATWVTDADLWLARQVDPDVAVALKNGGGIRNDIGVVIQPPGTTSTADVVYGPPPANSDAGTRDGDVSQLDIEGALRFKRWPVHHSANGAAVEGDCGARRRLCRRWTAGGRTVPADQRDAIQL